jgi:hypothetical protein
MRSATGSMLPSHARRGDATGTVGEPSVRLVGSQGNVRRIPEDTPRGKSLRVATLFRGAFWA